MIILSIETSCDDTSCAILEARGRKRPSFNVLSNVVSSQTKIHAPYGGVVPFLAARAHQKNLPIILKKSWQKSCRKIKNKKIPPMADPPKAEKIKNKNRKLKNFIDLITVTVGPGLEPSLWAGVNFAKSLSLISNIPVIGVNHIAGHIYANFINNKQNVKLPAICLIVSGGHTQLILIKNHGQYKLLGETRDDAAGEAFDKVAKMLELGYPGGPAIAAEAAKFLISNPQFLNKFKNKNSPPTADPPKAEKFKIQLPRPMINSDDYDFSFSGLKTAVLYKLQELQKLKMFHVPCSMFHERICAEFQQAVIDVLIRKTLRAAKEYKTKFILCGGGVMANQELRAQLKKAVQKELPNVVLRIPPIELCTDNATMIAVAGYYKYLRAGAVDDLRKIKADSNASI